MGELRRTLGQPIDAYPIACSHGSPNGRCPATPDLGCLASPDKGQMRLFENYRYFFYITNDRVMTAGQVVLSAGGRCNQENLIAQLKSGVYALATP